MLCFLNKLCHEFDSECVRNFVLDNPRRVFGRKQTVKLYEAFIMWSRCRQTRARLSFTMRTQRYKKSFYPYFLMKNYGFIFPAFYNNFNILH